MTDISNLIERARLIKNETETSANTAERVGQLLEDIINTFGSATPTRKTIRQVYDENGKLQVLFACNGSCVLKYSASVSGRSWGDELYYTSTNYPTADTFFTLTRQDFTESRYLGVPRGVCIPTKTVAAAPSIEFTFEVVYLKGSITWYDGDRLVSVSSEDIQCAKIATREDLSSAINLTTSAAGYIYNDQNEPVSSLADNTLYTMNASANGGAFTIPARNDYAGTTIFCYGDGVATLNGTDYAYTSGQTLVLEGGVVHVEDTDNDYYTKAETDAQIATAVSGKAADNAVVHKTGTETVGGTKTFSSSLYAKSRVYVGDGDAKVYVAGGKTGSNWSHLALHVYKNNSWEERCQFGDVIKVMNGTSYAELGTDQLNLGGAYGVSIWFNGQGLGCSKPITVTGNPYPITALDMTLASGERVFNFVTGYDRWQEVKFTNYSGETIAADLTYNRFIVTQSYGTVSILDISNGGIQIADGTTIEVINANGNTYTLKLNALESLVIGGGYTCSKIVAVVIASEWHVYKIAELTELTT